MQHHCLLVLLSLCLFALTSAIQAPLYTSPYWASGDEAFKPPFNNVVSQWVWNFLQLIRYAGNFSATDTRSLLGSSNFGSVARASVCLVNCMYDAYVAVASPNAFSKYNYVSGINMASNVSNNADNINMAISYAAYRALTYTYGNLNSTTFQPYIDSSLTELGYSTSYVSSTSMNQAYGVGNQACLNVISAFNMDNDLSNALGNQPGYPTPYSDYTNYQALNDPMPTIGQTNCAALRAGVDSWQPARVKIGPPSGIPLFWGDVQIANMKSWALTSNREYCCLQPPSRNNSATGAAWAAKNAAIVQVSGALDDHGKAIATFWNDGDGYGAALGLSFAIPSAQINNASLIQTLQLSFMTAHAYQEALFTQYAGKRYWNAPRPVTPVQCIYKGQQVNIWLGPYNGTGLNDGSNFQTYLPKSLIYPPTPEYPCGHCIGSAATFKAIQLFWQQQNGNPNFVGYIRSYQPGQFSLEPIVTDPNDPRFIAGKTNVPNTGSASVGYAPGAAGVTLNWWAGQTWEYLGHEVGNSRVYLGIHYNDSAIYSNGLGQTIGQRVFDVSQLLFNAPKIPGISDLPLLKKATDETVSVFI